MAQQTIVLAKVEMTGIEATGRHIMRDLNWHPEFRAAPEAKAVIWLNSGTPSDVVKAQRFADENGYRVWTFPTTEPNPISRAKKLALRLG